VKASNLAMNPIQRLHLVVFKTLFNIIVTSTFRFFQAIFPTKFLAKILYNLSALVLNIEHRIFLKWASITVSRSINHNTKQGRRQLTPADLQ
jgi:hypothetical protein